MKQINYIVENISKHISGGGIKRTLFWIFFIGSIIASFNYMNEVYEKKAPLILISNVFLGYKTEINMDTFFNEYMYYMTHIHYKKPLSLVYHAIPYFEALDTNGEEYSEEMRGYFKVAVQDEDFGEEKSEDYMPQLPDTKRIDLSEENFADPYYMLRYFITGDANLSIDADLLKKWDFTSYLHKEWRIDDTLEGPKILILHTHIRETYGGAKQKEQGVMAVGEELKKLLEEKYGIETMHLTQDFYNETGIQDKLEYDRVDKVVPGILEKYPSIQMVLDIHRDGVEGAKLVTEVNGKKTARIMFVQGICEVINKEGERIPTNLRNEYIQDNLSFALQTQIQANKYYPGLARKIYLKPYRYSLHMKPMSLIVEVGAQNNTLEEAVNSAYPLADIIAKVVEKD